MDRREGGGGGADGVDDGADGVDDGAGEARGAADLHAAPRIVSWALRRNRDTEARDE